VCLAATEVGLKVDDWGGIHVPADPANPTLQKVSEAFGKECATEELNGLHILSSALAFGDARQVSSEL
jgi:hypothetical protein